MNASSTSAGWSGPRIAVLIGVATIVQTAVVLQVGLVPDIPLKTTRPRGQVSMLWTTGQVEAAFEGVPGARLDVLERDGADAFQRVARQSVPPPEYRLAEWREPKRWLTNPVALPRVETASAVTMTHSLEAAHSPLPGVPTRPLVAEQTRVTVEGGLAGRPWRSRPVPGAWTGGETPGITRMEIAVNPQGWVVMAQVIESSGSKSADDAARRAVASALFAPVPGASRRPEFVLAQLEWGQVSVHWTLPAAKP